MVELENRIESLRQVNFDLVPADNEPERIDVDLPHILFPDEMISILVGEVIHNLRSALDYLVYALAWADSRKFQEKTQFPIDDSPRVFKQRKEGKRSGLTGLNRSHIAEIERLQPYKRCDWTKRLRDLSNHDKHRELIKVTSLGKFSVKVGSFGDPTANPKTIADMGIDMQMKSAISGPVTFADGTPVIDTLEILQTQVANLLIQFEPLFGRIR